MRHKEVVQEAIPRVDYEGVSVSIEEAHIALRGLAEAYAQFARAEGLQRVAKTPSARSGRLAERYGSNLPRVVEGSRQNAKDVLNAAVAQHMPVLTREEDLVEAGFDAKKAEKQAQATTIGVRHAIGVSVGAKARNLYMKGLYKPEETKKAS